MSLAELYQVIPKTPSIWTNGDVVKWLQWLKVKVKLSKFVEAGVDGSVMHAINIEDLENELEVSSLGTRKRLMEWFKNTLNQYHHYVTTKLDTQMIVEPLVEKRYSLETTATNELESSDDKIELYIRPFEEDNADGDHFYKLTNEHMIIGRSSNCQMIVRESTVSGLHAKIWKEGNKFFLQDSGSKNGTYIKTREREYLEVGNMLEMGEYLFEVTRLDQTSMEMLCTRIEFENIPLKIEITENQSYTIGRNPDNDLSFVDDLHLSGRHAKIYLLNGRFVIEDLDSTNGTWRRIAKSGIISEPERIHNKTVIKIGNSNSYMCNLSSNTASKEIDRDWCLICKQSKPKDGLLLPCRHLVGCYECIASATSCPICNMAITTSIKIYS